MSRTTNDVELLSIGSLRDGESKDKIKFSDEGLKLLRDNLFTSEWLSKIKIFSDLRKFLNTFSESKYDIPRPLLAAIVYIKYHFSKSENDETSTSAARFFDIHYTIYHRQKRYENRNAHHELTAEEARRAFLFVVLIFILKDLSERHSSPRPQSLVWLLCDALLPLGLHAREDLFESIKQKDPAPVMAEIIKEYKLDTSVLLEEVKDESKLEDKMRDQQDPLRRLLKPTPEDTGKYCLDAMYTVLNTNQKRAFLQVLGEDPDCYDFASSCAVM